MIRKVKHCTDCPFASKSLGGRAESALISDKKRMYLSCNLQNLGAQYRVDQKYNFFETSPLESGSIEIKLSL